MGEAFLAIDLVGTEQVVVKLLHHGREFSGTQHHWLKHHFQNESQALRLIDHPGIVKFIDTGETEEGHPFLVMEFVDGASLRSQIDPSDGLLGGFERTAAILRQLGDALSAAHEKGVYHRDLKPENIMLKHVGAPDEQIKVIDFGIATVKDQLDEKTKTTVMAGSLHYLAPEQLEGHPGAASDIFALGVIAYELVTGRTPFRPDRPYPAAIFQLSELHRGGVRVKPKDLRPGLPAAAQEIILKALSFHPVDRPPTAREYGAELAACLIDDTSDPKSVIHTPLAGDEPPTTTLFESEPEAQKTLADPDQSGQSRIGRNRLQGGVLIGGILLVVAGGWYVFQVAGLVWPGHPPPVNDVKSPIELRYWAQVEPRKGRPFRLGGGIAGETRFNTGDRITIHINSGRSGYLYMLCQTENQPEFFLLFPSPGASSTVSAVTATKEAVTSQIIFDEQANTENLWLVWSASQIQTLEATFAQWGNLQSKGIVMDPVTNQALSKLLQDGAKIKPTLKKDPQVDQTIVHASGDQIVVCLRLIHQ